MENGRDRSQLAIPGLFRELDKETKEGIKGIFRQLSANGQSYSQLHHEARWKAAERRQMWALWNDAGLPVMPAEVAFYTALFESDDTIVDQYSGPEFLSAMQVVDRVSTTAQSGRAETVASSATRTEKTHIESSIQREAAVPVSSTATSVRIEKPSEHVASTSASISKQISAKLPTTASAPVEAASDRDAYVRRLQALKNKKPTVGSDVSTATKFAVSESPSLIAVKTAVPATPPKGPNQNKDEILKQKLEALRKATGKGSNSMSSLHTQDATAQPSQPSPSTAPQLQSFPHTGGTQPSLLTQHHKAPNLPYRPSSPPRQPAVTASSPQTPVTPIPGLFMNDSQPPFGQSYFYPPSQYPLTSSGPYNGYPAASTQYPSTTTGYTGYPTDHALSGQTSGFPSRPRPAIPIGHRPDQVQSSVQQEPVVINLNDSEDENGEEMDLEAETATQSKHPPITRTADDAISPSARASTEAQSTIAQLESTPNQQEQNKAQQQTQSKEQLERRIAELKAKFKADRAQQSLSKKQASAESSIAPTPVNAGQSSTNGVGLAVPATHPAKNATLPTPSEVIGPEQATPVSTNQQKKRPSEDADVSPEWRKKRRAELQSDLESRDQDLGSTAAKIAEMQRQLAQLQEEQLRQQQARETLAKELEELGVDTEGMSHEEMQATKDDIEAAQQQSLTMQDQGVPTNNGPAHTPAAPITTGPNSAPAQLAEEETVLLPGEVMVSVLVSTDNAWAAEGITPISDDLYTWMCLTIIVNEPSPSHEAEVQSTSEDDAMSIDTTDENDNVPVATIPPATEAAKKDDNRPWSSYKFDGIDVNDVYDPEDPLSSDDLDVEMNKPQAEKGPQAETSAQLISSAHTAATEVNQVKGEDEAYDPADLVLTAPAEPSHPPKEDSPIIQDTENADVAILATQEATERWLSALEQPETSAASAADMPKPEPRPYVPYESPLSMFKAYRFHPEYSQKVSGFRSLTYSHAIEPFTEFCATELNGGVCNDTTCHFQHFGKGVVELTGTCHPVLIPPHTS